MTRLLSVITTVYNCEKYIKQSLSSVFEQSFQDFELIIVNDGSVDKTVSFLEEFLHEDNIIFINHKNNKKIPTRRNEAINRAEGEFIAIHDGDDISFPDRFFKQVKFLKENKDVFCVGGKALKINEKDEVCGRMDYPPENHNEIVNMVINKCMNPIVDPSTMFRKKIFDKLGGYNEKELLVPDFDLWLRAIKNNCQFYNIQDDIIKYRTNSQGNTLKYKQQMIKHHMMVWRAFMKEYKGKK